MTLITPVAPTLSAVNPTSLTVTVNADGNPGGTYYAFQLVTGSSLKYITSGGGLQDTIAWLLVPTVSPVGLLPNSGYAVALAAASDAIGTGATGFGPAANTTTLASNPVPNPFTNVFSDTIQATWINNGNPAGTQYQVQISPDSGFVQNVSNSGLITSPGFTFTGLLPSTTYYGRVRAENSVSSFTSWIAFTPVMTSAGPQTVKALDVINLLAERGMLIAWQPNLENNIVGYRVYRSPSPTDISSFILLAQTPPNVSNYIDTVPYSFGIVFYYKVTALDSGGNESNLTLTTPVQDNTFHSFEEQPFYSTIQPVNPQVVDETPAGLINGSNTVFSVAFAYKAGSLQVYVNGIRQTKPTNLSEGPTAVQFTFAVAPANGDIIRVDYARLI